LKVTPKARNGLIS